MRGAQAGRAAPPRTAEACARACGAATAACVSAAAQAPPAAAAALLLVAAAQGLPAAGLGPASPRSRLGAGPDAGSCHVASAAAAVAALRPGVVVGADAVTLLRAALALALDAPAPAAAAAAAAAAASLLNKWEAGAQSARTTDT